MGVKSDEVIKGYYDRRDEIRSGIQKLSEEIETHKKEHDSKNKEYKELVRVGKDDEADGLLDEIEAISGQIKKKKQRLKTKQGLAGESIVDKAVETLAYANQVKYEYTGELKEIDNAIAQKMTEVYELLESKRGVLDDYEDDYARYERIYDDNTRIPDTKSQEFKKRTSFRINPGTISTFDNDLRKEAKKYKNEGVKA